MTAICASRHEDLVSNGAVSPHVCDPMVGFCRKVRFLGKIQKLDVRNSMTYSARFAHFSGRFDSFSAESRINVERKVQQRQKALLQC
jgi:hypothetical protein